MASIQHRKEIRFYSLVVGIQKIQNTKTIMTWQ